MAYRIPSLSFFVDARRRILHAAREADLPPMFSSAFRFLKHENMRRFAVKRFSFVRTADGAVMNGITGPLDEIIHPISLALSTGGAKTGGSARGSTTDNQLAKLINHGMLPENDEFHKYTVKVMDYLYQHGLVPIASQVLVCCELLNMGTKLDLVCIDTKVADVENNLVNIQLKTGFDKNYTTVVGKMMSPFFNNSLLTSLDDTYANRHMIQNMVEHWIVQKNYDKVLCRSQVLVVSENSIRCDVLSVDDRDSDLYAAVLSELMNRNCRSRCSIAVTNLRRHYARKAAVEVKRKNKAK